MYRPTTPTNAPNTTIQISTVELVFLVRSSFVKVVVEFFDARGAPIGIPTPIREMTTAERTAFLAVPAMKSPWVNEPPFAHLARAAAPYLLAAAGLVLEPVS
jgi:hypothetical protein